MTKLRAILKRRWPVIAVCLSLGIVAGLVSSQVATKDVRKLYTAQQVIVANAGSGAVSLVSQDALKVTRREVARRAAKILKSDESPDTLAAKILPVFDSKTSSIAVSSDDVDPKVAAKRVDAFVQAFLKVENDRLQQADKSQLAQVTAELTQAKADLAQFDLEHPELQDPTAQSSPLLQQLLGKRDALEAKIEQLDSDKRTRELALIRNLPYATLGYEKPKPAQSGLIDVPASKLARAFLLGFLGLLLGSGIVMLIERMNRRIDTREELVEVTDLPVLAEVAYVRESRRAIEPDGRIALAGVWAEPYRRVRSAIQFVQSSAGVSGWTALPGSPSEQLGAGPSVFLVTSTSPAEGKSTTSALAAMALAEVGVPTVLVGGDFRKPQVDRLIGVNDAPASLQDLARLDIERPTIDQVVQPTAIDDLYMAVAGAATREVAGMVEAAKAVCTEAVARGATVVIDSSPLQAANDTLDFLPAVDYVILVLRVGKSSESDLLDTIATLRRLDGRILGIVLIGTHSSRKQEYYYDYYSHGPLASSGEGATSAT